MPIDASFLFPEYRKRVLGLLLLHPDQQYHVREIARLTNTVPGSLHRELSKLWKANILKREISGRQVYYQANIIFPLFKEIASILKKTSGVVDVLATALEPLSKKIEVAFIFGSVARDTENENSDIDLLMIGKIRFSEAIKILYPVQNALDREINPKIYTKITWKKLLKNKNSFIREIINQPKLFIIGNIDDIK